MLAKSAKAYTCSHGYTFITFWRSPTEHEHLIATMVVGGYATISTLAALPKQPVDEVATVVTPRWGFEIMDPEVVGGTHNLLRLSLMGPCTGTPAD